MFLFTKTQHERVATLPDGTNVRCPNPRELHFLYEEIYRESIYLRNGISLNEGDCVVDVGAHVGLFSLFLMQHYSDLDLYAIEPVPAAFSMLLSNAEQHFPLARCIPAALAERDRRIQLAWYPQLSSCSTRYPDLNDLRSNLRTHCALSDYRVIGPLARQVPRMFDLCTRPLLEQMQIEVHATTLSAIMTSEGIGRIDLLKIDVEGSDLQVLLGIQEADWQRIRQIVVKTTYTDLDAVVHALRTHGFRLMTDVSLGLRGTDYLYVYARARD